MILAILQARVSSSRLPYKVLKPILGRPMLSLQIERVKRSRCIDKIVVATSSEVGDDPIESLCVQMQVSCFRGSLNDVLDRFYRTALLYGPEYVVRVTGDCPLIDPQVIDAVINFFQDGKYDYATNALEPTFPDGLDIEVFTFAALATAWQESCLPSHREHVTPFIHQNNGRFKIGHYKGPVDLSDLRWTVDEPEDFDLVCRIYEALYPRHPGFTTQDILNFLSKNTSLFMINCDIGRNEGMQKSLETDRDFQQGKIPKKSGERR